MFQLLFVLFASFFGIFINVWLLLLILENRSNLFKKKIIKKFPKVSVLIPAHNEENNIKNTVNSVLNLKYPRKKLEVIVIDNGSNDRTSKIVKSFRKVKLIKLRKASKAYALNKGLEKAKGEIVGILDADSRVSKNCLKKTVGYFDDPKVGAVTTFINVDNKKSVLSKMQNIEYLFSAITKKLISFLNSMYVVPGSLSLVRKNLAEEIGFSEDTLTEDMDMALSISKKGYKIVNCLDAVAFTTIPKDFKKLTKQRLRWYRGFIENTFKHSDIVFNKNFFHLGCFIIPISFTAIIIGVVLSTLLFFDIFHYILIFLRSVYYIPILDQLVLNLNNINSTNILLAPYAPIAYILVFSTSFFILYCSLKLLFSANKKNVALIPFYMLGYYFLLMIYWCIAFFLEVFRWKKKW